MPSDSFSRAPQGNRLFFPQSGKLARCCLIVGLFFGAQTISPSAHGSDLSGTWTASSLRVSWAIGDWGAACGPRPSGGGETGGRVTLTNDSGGFRLQGLGRSYSSSQCWEQMPGLTTRNRSTSTATISATCSMPAGDPRQAKVVTSWYPRGDQIYFDETGQYQFIVSGSNCTASVRRTRVLTRFVEVTPAAVQPDAASELAAQEKSNAAKNPSVNKPEATAPPLPHSSSHCKKLGHATEVEVTPRAKLMRQGETFTFQLNARDTAGCRVPASAKWTLLSGQGAQLSDSGELQIDENAPTGEVQLKVEAFGQTLPLTARVVSDSEYESLIAGGSFGALGESLETAAVELSSHVELESIEPPAEQGNNKLWLILVGGLLLALGAAVIALLKHSAKAAARKSKSHRIQQVLAEDEGDSVTTELPPQAPISPPQQAAVGSNSFETCQPAAPAAPVVPVVPVVQTPPTRLCPVCGKRYDDGTAFCGEDGARLMRAN